MNELKSLVGAIGLNREYEFTGELSKTRSKKIMHHVFQARELGLKEEESVIL